MTVRVCDDPDCRAHGQQIKALADLREELQRVLPEFVQWVASNRAYNGSDHEHGQSLYNECLNGVLGDWARDFAFEKGLGHE